MRYFKCIKAWIQNRIYIKAYLFLDCSISLSYEINSNDRASAILWNECTWEEKEEMVGEKKEEERNKKSSCGQKKEVKTASKLLMLGEEGEGEWDGLASQATSQLLGEKCKGEMKPFSFTSEWAERGLCYFGPPSQNKRLNGNISRKILHPVFNRSRVKLSRIFLLVLFCH